MSEKFRSTVTDRGQTSIPAVLRRALKLKPGLTLQWRFVGPNELRVTLDGGRLDCPGPLATLGYARKFHPKDTRSTDEILAELREGDEE